MPKREPSDLEALEAAAEAAEAGAYALHLVISGRGHHSATALKNVRRFCEDHLPGRYTLTVTDLGKHPREARALEIFATPTLIRTAPLPVRRFVGNMAHLEALLVAGAPRLPTPPPGRPAHD